MGTLMKPFGPNDDYFEDDDRQGEGGQGEQGGAGGSVGEIIFRFPDLITQRRDDLLPPNEIKRLLLVEKDLHKALTNNQKELLKQRKELKEGKKPQQTYGNGYGYGEVSNYKPHPNLSTKPQFAGADPKMVGVPELNQSKTNNEKQLKNELKMSPRPQAELKNTPTFAPKFTPYK